MTAAEAKAAVFNTVLRVANDRIEASSLTLTIFLKSALSSSYFA
jgi:hypothetical protein